MNINFSDFKPTKANLKSWINELKKPEHFTLYLVLLQVLLLLILGGAILVYTPIGVLIQVMGIFLAFWAFRQINPAHFKLRPEVNVNATLIKTGPYKYVRHPLYASIFIIVIPGIIEQLSVFNTIVFLVLGALLIFKIELEEKFLSAHFNEQYEEYKKTTWKLIPKVY